MMLLPKAPLLAATIETEDDLANLQLPLLLSEKKNGIRGITAGKIRGCVSRKLKNIPNEWIRFLLSGLPPGIEGEIVCFDCEGNEADFEDTESTVMSREGQPSFKFFVFDRWQGTKFMPYRKRVDGLELICSSYEPVDCILLNQIFCKTVQHIQNLYKSYTEDGAEGVMIRDPVGFYKFGRSTLNEQLLMKYKPWNDDEAEVIRIEEEMKNNNVKTKNNLGLSKRSTHIANLQGKGRMGALICKNKRFGEFRLSGFNDNLKQQLWDVMLNNDDPFWPTKFSKLNFRYRGVTKYGKPRNAAFVRFV